MPVTTILLFRHSALEREISVICTDKKHIYTYSMTVSLFYYFRNIKRYSIKVEKISYGFPFQNDRGIIYDNQLIINNDYCRKNVVLLMQLLYCQNGLENE